MKRTAPAITAAFLARKGAALTAQDREWVADLPAGWFTRRDAAAAWGLAVRTSVNRLSLLRSSGLVDFVNGGMNGRWIVTRRPS